MYYFIFIEHVSTEFNTKFGSCGYFNLRIVRSKRQLILNESAEKTGMIRVAACMVTSPFVSARCPNHGESGTGFPLGGKQEDIDSSTQEWRRHRVPEKRVLETFREKREAADYISAFWPSVGRICRSWGRCRDAPPGQAQSHCVLLKLTDSAPTASTSGSHSLAPIPKTPPIPPFGLVKNVHIFKLKLWNNNCCLVSWDVNSCCREEGNQLWGPGQQS